VPEGVVSQHEGEKVTTMEAKTWKWQKKMKGKRKPQRNELHVLQRQNEVGMEWNVQRKEGATGCQLLLKNGKHVLMHIIENHKIRDDIQRLVKLHRFGNGEADGRSLTIS
jgi:hypothetical protein